MHTVTSRTLKPREGVRAYWLSNLLRHLAAVVLASLALGVALAQGLDLGGIISGLDFWSAVAPIAAMTLLTVEVLKRRAPDAVSGARGLALSLAVGLVWGTLMHYSPSFRMFDSVTDSITYGLVSGIVASGFFDVVVSPMQQALRRLGEPTRTVQVITHTAPSGGTSEPNPIDDPFAARVAARDLPTA
jgi:membrane-bound metal-dependent hydrolase YbcI (DUF457 family)